MLSIVGGPGSQLGPRAVAARLGARRRRSARALPDPRGSGSYGRAWLEAISGDWGDADAADDLACVDWAVGEGLADPARLGVTGLSYGGFMTQWLISQDDRFRAAVAVNGVANQISAAGNCDQGALWTPRLGWERPPADTERLWQQSPLAHADRITTPLLMLQGEADLRCPPADNEQLFVALRALGKPVEYVLYPEEIAPDAVDRPPRPPHRHARAHGSPGSARTACSTRASAARRVSSAAPRNPALPHTSGSGPYSAGLTRSCAGLTAAVRFGADATRHAGKSRSRHGVMRARGVGS